MAQSKATQTVSPPRLSIAIQTVPPRSIAIQTVPPRSIATQSDLQKKPTAIQTVSPPSIATLTVSQVTTAAIQSVPQIFQFKVLLGIKSPVWRRIQLLADSDFKDLHYAIQCVMGWSNTHLYKFEISKIPVSFRRRYVSEYGDEDFDPIKVFEMSMRDDRLTHRSIPADTPLRKWFPVPKEYKPLRYMYDLGSTWDHKVVLEKTLPAVEGETYPKCIAGRKATPPEDPTESEIEDYEEDPDFKFDPKSVDFGLYHDRDKFGLGENDSEFRLSEDDW